MSRGLSFLQSPHACSCSRPPSLQGLAPSLIQKTVLSKMQPPQPRGSVSYPPCCGPPLPSTMQAPTPSPPVKTLKSDPAPSSAQASVQSEANLSFSWADEHSHHNSPYAGPPNHTCSKCEKQFFNLVRLRRHEEYCCRDVVFRCKMCSAVFKSLPSMVAHECSKSILYGGDKVNKKP